MDVVVIVRSDDCGMVMVHGDVCSRRRENFSSVVIKFEMLREIMLIYLYFKLTKNVF